MLHTFSDTDFSAFLAVVSTAFTSFFTADSICFILSSIPLTTDVRMAAISEIIFSAWRKPARN